MNLDWRSELFQLHQLYDQNSKAWNSYRLETIVVSRLTNTIPSITSSLKKMVRPENQQVRHKVNIIFWNLCLLFLKELQQPQLSHYGSGSFLVSFTVGCKGFKLRHLTETDFDCPSTMLYRRWPFLCKHECCLYGQRRSHVKAYLYQRQCTYLSFGLPSYRKLWWNTEMYMSRLGQMALPLLWPPHPLFWEYGFDVLPNQSWVHNVCLCVRF